MGMDDGLKACERLVHAFAWHIDHHDAEQAAGLFAEDAVFERRGEALKGRDAIRSAFLKRPASVLTRHLCSNLLLDAESATRIVGRSYFTLSRGDAAAHGDRGQGVDSADRVVVGQRRLAIPRPAKAASVNMVSTPPFTKIVGVAGPAQVPETSALLPVATCPLPKLTRNRLRTPGAMG